MSDQFFGFTFIIDGGVGGIRKALMAYPKTARHLALS